MVPPSAEPSMSGVSSPSSSRLMIGKQQRSSQLVTSSSSSSNGAVNAVALLLREDPLLAAHDLTTAESNESGAFAYAASLLRSTSSSGSSVNGEGKEWTATSGGEISKKALDALAEVERKLVLVESLAQRICRDGSDDVALPLLRLHGYGNGFPPKLPDTTAMSIENVAATSVSTTTTLTEIKEGADRLRRRAEVLESVANRVETTLTRALGRMESATERLSRVLQLSSTLKMAMRLRFESRKVLGTAGSTSTGTSSAGAASTLDVDALLGSMRPMTSSFGTTNGTTTNIDLRDLTRAAAGVAIMEELLSHDDLKGGIDIVERVRPDAEAAATAVRRAAAGLLLGSDSDDAASAKTTDGSGTAALTSSMSSPSSLGATLQVYFHLGELSQATWNAVERALYAADAASSQFFNSSTMRRLVETAKAEAKAALAEAADKGTDSSSGSSDPSSATSDVAASSSSSSSATPSGPTNIVASKLQKRRQDEAKFDHALRRKLREGRSDAAQRWANGFVEAALTVWNLHHVLSRKTDPVSRQNFLSVVTASSVPSKFKIAQEMLLSSLPLNYDDDKSSNIARIKNSIFAIFWTQACILLGGRIDRLLRSESGSTEEISAVYPAIRASAIDALGAIHDAMRAGGAVGRGTSSSSSAMMSGGGTWMDDGMPSSTSISLSTTSAGIMGGSASLDDAVLFGPNFFGAAVAAGAGGTGTLSSIFSSSEPVVGADSWTRPSDTAAAAAATVGGTVVGSTSSSTTSAAITASRLNAASRATLAASSSALSGIFSSPEWTSLQGGGGGASGTVGTGLHPLHRAFLDSCRSRLCAPLQFMFPEAVTVDENGVAIPVLPQLPSRHDLKKIEETVRTELSLADPRGGGGEFSMTTMISECVVEMIEKFCVDAGNATSDATMNGKDDDDDEKDMSGILRDDGTPTDDLIHDYKVAGVLNTVAKSLRNVPESTFVVPYRPAHSPQHEEAANMCEIALLPALHEIDGLAKSKILIPVVHTLNSRVAAAIAKMHRGTYMEEAQDTGVGGGGAFVQQHLAPVYESISTHHLSKIPSEYAAIVSSTVAKHSIYTFASHVSLVRPLGEMGRLRIAQDLAELELALEQFILGSGSSKTLGQIDDGRPYAELRAVREMLFWSGLSDGDTSSSRGPSADALAKTILRQDWARDARPSTVFHFLFSFAPPLLSSPHHAKRVTAEEYVNSLVTLDGNVDDGEASAWMTTMACCDAYQQRESVDSGGGGGDKRIAAILMLLGPELLRRRRP